jgi:RHS repeat-associated protein
MVGYVYDADGRLAHVRPDGAEPSPGPAPDGDAWFAERILFTTPKLDGDRCLLHAQARTYDPTVGVWMVQEPVAFRGGDSYLHRYAATDPAELPPARTPDGAPG